jgi:coenzyme F420-reducing hydrogenase gamma subunit
MSILISFGIGAVVGAIAGIAIYRNNEEKLDPIADKVDEYVDKKKG